MGSQAEMSKNRDADRADAGDGSSPDRVLLLYDTEWTAGKQVPSDRLPTRAKVGKQQRPSR